MAKPEYVADLSAYFSRAVLARENAISDHDGGVMRLMERAILRGTTIVLNLRIDGLAHLAATPNPNKAEAAALLEEATGTKDYKEFAVYSLMEYRVFSAFIQSWHIRQRQAGNLFPRSNTFIRHRGIVRSVSDTLLDQNPKRLKRFIAEHEAGMQQRPQIVLFPFEENHLPKPAGNERVWASPVVTVPSFDGAKDSLRFTVTLKDPVMNNLFERAQEKGDHTALVSIITNKSLEQALGTRKTPEDVADIPVPLTRQGQLHPLLSNPYSQYVYGDGKRPVMGSRKKFLWQLP